MNIRTCLPILSVLLAMSCVVLGHPLGNFSVNQYSRLEVGSSSVKVRQVVDMAEIPTFQLSPEIDTDADGAMSQAELDAFGVVLTPQLLSKLSLSVNGLPVQLRAVDTKISTISGSGGLPTLRAEWDLAGDLKGLNDVNRVSFQNGNYPERLGWNEIVIKRDAGVNVFDSDAFGSGVTDEIHSYPQASLDAPLRERSAAFSFSSKPAPENSKTLLNRDGKASAAVQKDKLAELIAVPEVTPAIALFGLLVAFGLGALHALSPGHGKTVVGAYLVGSRGTFRHAVFLGLTVTVTHTLGVFALGLITLFASNYILPERLMPILSFFSGALVLFIGLSMFKSRLLASLGGDQGGHTHSHGGHTHSHDVHAHDGHAHTHDGSTHTHMPPERLTWRGLLALGISGGLLPCPSALVLMLSAISLNRVGYGLVLTVVFSLGLAVTLTAVGLAFLFLGKIFDRPGLAQNRIVKIVPVFSAFVIVCLGAAICYSSLG
jgi:ABC-type nickel/cobalt efflux system permease component RcnA